jgi:hypothetical protein
MPPVFDAHVHILPSGLFKAIWSWFDRYAWPIRYRPAAETVLPFLLNRGICGFIALPYAHKPGIARELNQTVYRLCSEVPFAFGFATVFPGEPDVEAILDEAFALGLQGVKLHPHVQGYAPSSPEVDRICDLCRSHSRSLLIHAGREPKTPLFDYPADPYALCAAESLELLLRNHPGLRLCVPHLGADEYMAYRRLLDRFDTLWLDTAMAISGFLPGLEPPGLESYPPERILYGSDFPNIPYPWDTELKILQKSRLSEEALYRITYANALEFLNLA